MFEFFKAFFLACLLANFCIGSNLISTMLAGSQDKGLCSCRTDETLFRYYHKTKNEADEVRFLKPHAGVADIVVKINAMVEWMKSAGLG